MKYPAYGKSKPYRGYEDRFQEAAAKALDSWPGLRWFHVANERKTTQRQGATLKRKGVKKGVHDIIVINPNKMFYGLVIELKTIQKGKTKPDEPTLEQLEWMVNFQNCKRYVCVCYNVEAVREVVKHYLNNTIMHYQNAAEIIEVNLTEMKQKAIKARIRKYSKPKNKRA